jgi:protein arginine kinase activator
MTADPPEDSENQIFPLSENDLPDRPIECTECKRPIMYRYTEVFGPTVNETCMCSECHVLQRRLGTVASSERDHSLDETATGLCCGNCGTTLQAVQMGSPLGCSVCYDVFGDVIVAELGNLKKISQRISKSKKSRQLHIGRGPGEAVKLNPSLRLIALNEALKETLSREDYEQAAWLRDQIKELTENSDGKK